MAELGTIRRYSYWADRRIRRIASDNGINLERHWRLAFRTPSAGLAPQAELAEELKSPQRHDVALKIENAIGRLAVEDFVTPPRARFAKGVGNVTFAVYTRWEPAAPAVVLHTRTVSTNGQRVELCLFGSIENCADYISSSGTDAPMWSSSSTWAIEEFLAHKGRKPAPIYDDDESIAVETLMVLNQEGMTGRYVRQRIHSAAWFAEIYHDAQLTIGRWNITPGVDLPEPVERILIGAPLWVRSSG